MKKLLFIFAILFTSVTFAQTDSTCCSSDCPSIMPYVAAGISIPNNSDFNAASYASTEVGVMIDNFTVAGVFGVSNLEPNSGYWYEGKVAVSQPLGYVSGYGVLGIGAYADGSSMFIEYGVGISKEFGNLGTFIQVSSWDGITYVTPGLSYSF